MNAENQPKPEDEVAYWKRNCRKAWYEVAMCAGYSEIESDEYADNEIKIAEQNRGKPE